MNDEKISNAEKTELLTSQPGSDGTSDAADIPEKKAADAESTAVSASDTVVRDPEKTRTAGEDDEGTMLLGDRTVLIASDVPPVIPAQQTQPQTAASPEAGVTVDLIPKEVIGNDLTDIRPMNAKGGMSNLFLAHKEGLEVEVVIKRVKSAFHNKLNEDSEARVMTALRHQYLPRIYDLRKANDGYTYTIMELIEGETLKKYVEKHGALDQKLALKWTRQLCEVISYMHTRSPFGIIHSDLKPDNVMITPQMDICVIDFNASLTVSEDAENMPDPIAATRGYAAPEQYNTPLERLRETDSLYPLVKAAQNMGRICPGTDIYAIGALAYYMLAAKSPLIWTEKQIPLADCAKVGDAFREIIEKAMEVESPKRYKSAALMLQKLNSLNRTDKRYKRHMRLERIAAVVISAGIVGSALYAYAGFQKVGVEKERLYYENLQDTVQKYETGELPLDETVEKLSDLITKNSDKSDAFIELGTIYYSTAEYEALNVLMAEAPSSEDPVTEANLRYLRGSGFYQTGAWEPALEEYKTAAELIPDNAGYQRELAIAYAKCGMQDEADAALEALKAITKNEADILLVTGEIALSAGKYDAAFDALKKAAELTDDDLVSGRAYLQAADCCKKLGGGWIAKECSMLETAYKRFRFTQSYMMRSLLADAYIAQANEDSANAKQYYEKALACYDDLKESGYSAFQVRQNRAVVLQYLDRFQEAMDELEQMKKDFPDNYRIPMLLALIWIDREGTNNTGTRNYGSAVTNYEEAKALYAKAGVQDSEMAYLESMIEQLKEYNWIK